MARIKRITRIPLVTIVRLMGAMRRRLNPESVAPGADSTPDGDAAVIAMLEKRIRESKNGSGDKI